jgi:hypothetical protein
MIWGSWPSRSGCFSALSVPRGRSASSWRTVRATRVRQVFFVFLLAFRFDPSWFWVLVGRSFGRSACAGRTVRGCLADSPRAPRGQSVFRGASLVVLMSFSNSSGLRPDGPRQGCGQSTIPCRTVGATLADRPPCLAGQSARGWQLCFLVRFLPSSFVLPHVLQGIVPRTWGWSITLLSWRLVCDSIHRLCVTGIWLGYRPGSLRRIFTGSYSLPPLSSRHLILHGMNSTRGSTPQIQLPISRIAPRICARLWG